MLYSCFIVSQDLILLKNNCSDAARLIARDQSNCFFFCTHVVRCVLASLIRANVRLERTTRPFKMAFCVLLGSPLCFSLFHASNNRPFLHTIIGRSSAWKKCVQKWPYFPVAKWMESGHGSSTTLRCF
jgi:hypothetical protein